MFLVRLYLTEITINLVSEQEKVSAYRIGVDVEIISLFKDIGASPIGWYRATKAQNQVTRSIDLANGHHRCIL